MICKNCGEQLLNDAVFCINCGQKVENISKLEAPVTQEIYSNHMQYSPIQNNQISPKKSKKGIITGTIAFLLVLIAAIMALVIVIKDNKDNHTKTKVIDDKDIEAQTVDLLKYIEVTCVGCDGYGIAEVNIDRTALKAAFLKAQENNSKLSETEKENNAQNFIYEILVYLGKDENLSNGDKIEVEIIAPDANQLKSAGIIVEDVKYTVEVSGLGKIKEVNIFDDIEITCEGLEYEVYAHLENNSDDEYLSTVVFTKSKDYRLSKGDVLTVSIDESEIKRALKNGYKFTETSRNYIISNIDNYYSRYGDIDEETIAEMNIIAEDIVKLNFEYLDDVVAENIMQIGSYFAINTDEDDWLYYKNYYYPVFSVEVSSTDNSFEKTTIYCMVELYNIIDRASRDDTYDTSGYVIGYTDLMTSDYVTICGCNNLEEIYKYCIEYKGYSVVIESIVGNALKHPDR